MTPAQSLHLDSLVRRHWSKLQGWAYLMARSCGMEAEDLLASGLLYAARSFHRFDPRRASFSTWAFRCLRSALNHARRYQDCQKRGASCPLPEQFPDLQDAQGQLLDRMWLAAGLSRLEATERQTLYRMLQGYSQVEDAEACGRTKSTISLRRQQALKALRRKLA